MKKYTTSKYYLIVYVLAILFLALPTVILGIIEAAKGKISSELIIGITSLVILLYLMLFDSPIGSFMVDDSKIIMIAAFKKYGHNWSDFVDYGFVKSYSGNGYLYWVYLSTFELTYDQHRRFLKKTRKDLKNIAYFKYNESNFDEILSFMPKEMAAKLKEEEAEVREQMSLLEEKYH